MRPTPRSTGTPGSFAAALSRASTAVTLPTTNSPPSSRAKSSPGSSGMRSLPNLKKRRLRLVFVADRIPAELRRIVEFLNGQLELTEVIAGEIKQDVEPGGGRANIVPRVIGETEMAGRVKRAADGTRRPRGTEEQFYARTHEKNPPELAARVLALYEHAKAHGSRQTFGRGKSPT